MAAKEFATLGIEASVVDRLKDFRRKVAADSGQDLTLTDAVAMLLNSWDKNSKNVRVAS